MLSGSFPKVCYVTNDTDIGQNTLQNDAAELFAYNLRRLMDERQINARTLAEKLAVTESVVSRWKSAKSAPALESIDIVAAFFGVNVSDLFLNPDSVIPIDVGTAYRVVGEALGIRSAKK